MIHVPAFRRGLRPDVLDDNTAVLASTEERFTIAGPYCGAVAKCVDGRRTAAEIVHLLSSDISSSAALFALVLLESKGLLMEAESTLPPAATDFWLSLDVPPREAADRLREATFSVRSLCTDGTEQVSEALQRAGLKRDDACGLRIVVADDYLDPRLDGLNHDFLKSGTPWILTKPNGIGRIGPIFRTGGACWECLASRMRQNSYLSQAEPVGSTLTAVESLANLAATEISKWIVLGRSPLENSLVTVDPFAFQVKRHTVFRRAQCKACGVDFRLDPSFVLLPSPAADVSPVDAEEKLFRHVSPATGIIPRILRRAAPADCLPVYVAAQHWPAAPSGVKPRKSDSVAVGSGTYAWEARVSCAAEALERYCIAFDGAEAMVRSRGGALDSLYIPLSTVLQVSERQYRNREEFNRCWGACWIPEPADEDAEIDWLPVRSLVRNETCYAPAAYCLLDYPFSSPTRFCWADSNGCAAGATLEEAILRAFLELVERDAVALWWYTRAPHAEFRERRWTPMPAHYMAGRLAARNRSLHVLDLTTDLGIPVLAAISAQSDGSKVVFGFGASFSPEIALRRAVLEMHQVLGACDAIEQSAGAIESTLQRWLRTVNLTAEPWLRPSQGAFQPAWRTFDSPPGLASCLSILDGLGMDLYVANLTRPDVQLPVVRAIVPGLRSAQPRFAPGRLFDVPFALDWLSGPLPEVDLNPFPFFL